MYPWKICKAKRDKGLQQPSVKVVCELKLKISYFLKHRTETTKHPTPGVSTQRTVKSVQFVPSAAGVYRIYLSIYRKHGSCFKKSSSTSPSRCKVSLHVARFNFCWSQIGIYDLPVRRRCVKMPSCRRHAAPPSATFLQEGGGGHPRTLPSFRCHPGLLFARSRCEPPPRQYCSQFLFFSKRKYEKKYRPVEKMTNNAALRRDYRHQKMNALLHPSNGMFSVVTCYIRLVISIRVWLGMKSCRTQRSATSFQFRKVRCGPFLLALQRYFNETFGKIAISFVEAIFYYILTVLW